MISCKTSRLSFLMFVAGFKPFSPASPQFLQVHLAYMHMHPDSSCIHVSYVLLNLLLKTVRYFNLVNQTCSLQLWEKKDFNLEREQAHQAAETAAEEERLRKHTKWDQERRTADTRTEARLQRKRSRQNQRFAAESEEQREVRLRLSDNQRVRLARVSGWAWGHIKQDEYT